MPHNYFPEEVEDATVDAVTLHGIILVQRVIISFLVCLALLVASQT